MTASPQNFLQGLPVMTGLDEDALRFLGDLTVEEQYQAADVIVREGDRGDRMYFVFSGRVRVTKAPDVQLAEFGAGDFFGEMSLVECVVRSASVVALEPTRVFTLKGLDFYRLFRQRPEQYAIVMLNIARDLARRLRRLDEGFCHRAG